MIFVGNRRVNQGKSADSAEIHQDDQNKLRKNTELRCDSKGKPDRSDSGRRFVKAGAKRQTFCRADNNAADKKQQKELYAKALAYAAQMSGDDDVRAETVNRLKKLTE